MIPNLCEGATALKLENEIQEETVNEVQQFEQTNDEVLGNTTVSNEPIIEDVQSNDNPEVSNGLENFEMEEETPELFNSETETEENSSLETLDTNETKDVDEDDLEIPAFLRRQKN